MVTGINLLLVTTFEQKRQQKNSLTDYFFSIAIGCRVPLVAMRRTKKLVALVHFELHL